MSFEYIRKTYGVPAKRGGKVLIDDGGGGSIPGTLVSADHRVIVRTDCPKARLRFHPDDEALTYCDPLREGKE